MRPQALRVGAAGGLLCAGLILMAASPARADSYFLTVAGLGGEPDYEERFTREAADLDRVLKAAGPTVHAFTLAGKEATRAHLTETLQQIAGQAQPADDFVLTLIGHGSYDGTQYKFNLSGPDISAAALAQACDHIRAKRQLIVNTTSASGGSVAAFARPGRAVIAATKSGTEKNATVFARYWVEALQDPTADLDKNEGISALEAFQYATQKTAAFYESQKRLATEHAVFADTGDATMVRAAATDPAPPDPPPGSSAAAAASSSAPVKLVHFVWPVYPQGAGEQGGGVELQLTVKPDGTTTDVKVTASQPAGIFDQAAIDAASQWRYQPFTGAARSTRVKLKFDPPTDSVIAPDGSAPAGSTATPLKLTRFVGPTYPSTAIEGALTGSVELLFTVTPDGNTTDVTVARAVPAEIFNQAAIDAVSQWRYQPFQGEAQRAQVTLKFSLPTTAEGRSGGAQAVRAPPTRTGPGRMLASVTLIRLGKAGEAAANPAKRALLAHKQDLEQQIDNLKVQRAALSPQDYRQELSALLVQLAKVQEELDK